MAKAVQGTSFVQFTPLLESGAMHSKASASGRRLYKDATIIKAGLGNQRDKNYYPPDLLEANVKKFDGLRAYADHPDSLSEEVQPERTVRDMVGVYTNPRFVREGKGGRIVADLHLFRSSKWLSDVVDDLIDLGQADKIGLSINGRGRTVEKPLQLEEAADPVNVNWVEEFLMLRSADVVTEAGAGGGFPQLLESARGSTHEETAMKRLTEQNKAAMKAAVDAGDFDKLSVLMTECGCEGAPKGKRKAAAVEAEDDQIEDDVTEADEESEDALDAEADAIKEATEDEESEEDDEDADDLDESDDDLSDEDGDDMEEAKGSGLPKGAGVIVKGNGKGKHDAMIKGPKTSNNGSAVRPSKQTGGQGGRRYAESNGGSSIDRKFDKLMRENARLSAQLRVRTTTDRARNLLRESSIPEKMRPEILRLMVGKSEDEMAGIVRYHERMIETAIEESTGYVEGAGAQFREGSFGSRRDVNAVSAALDGLPLKG